METQGKNAIQILNISTVINEGLKNREDDVVAIGPEPEAMRLQFLSILQYV